MGKRKRADERLVASQSVTEAKAQSWGHDLLALQNEYGQSRQNPCDARLNCSDGFILCHKALIPRHRLRPPLNFLGAKEASSPTPVDMTTWTLHQVSKFVMLLYTGEVTAEKCPKLKRLMRDALHPMTQPRYLDFPRNAISTRQASTGEGFKVPVIYKDVGSTKIRAFRRILEKSPGEAKGGAVYQDVYIYGNGTEIDAPIHDIGCDAPPPLTDVSPTSDDISFTQDPDHGFFCVPCSQIYCDKGDFLEHISQCKHHKEWPSSPTTGVIKVEPELMVLPLASNNSIQGMTAATGMKENVFGRVSAKYLHKPSTNPNGDDFGIMCLVCVRRCRDSYVLIMHSNKKHSISPAEDYDLGLRVCNYCRAQFSDFDLPVFLQHVIRCKLDCMTALNWGVRPSSPEKQVVIEEVVASPKVAESDEFSVFINDLLSKGDTGVSDQDRAAKEAFGSEKLCGLRIVNISSLTEPAGVVFPGANADEKECVPSQGPSERPQNYVPAEDTFEDVKKPRFDSGVLTSRTDVKNNLASHVKGNVSKQKMDKEFSFKVEKTAEANKVERKPRVVKTSSNSLSIRKRCSPPATQARPSSQSQSTEMKDLKQEHGNVPTRPASSQSSTTRSYIWRCRCCSKSYANQKLYMFHNCRGSPGLTCHASVE